MGCRSQQVSLLKQKFRALDETVQNKDLLHYLIDFRIAGALINKYCDRLKSDIGNTETVASNMLACYDKKNHYKISLKSTVYNSKNSVYSYKDLTNQ